MRLYSSSHKRTPYSRHRFEIEKWLFPAFLVFGVRSIGASIYAIKKSSMCGHAKLISGEFISRHKSVQVHEIQGHNISMRARWYESYHNDSIYHKHAWKLRMCYTQLEIMNVSADISISRPVPVQLKTNEQRFHNHRDDNKRVLKLRLNLMAGSGLPKTS